MTPRSDETLVEAVLTAYRSRDREGRIMPPPEWWDLHPDARQEAHRSSLEARRIERALDGRGRSGTVRAVMDRIRGSS